MELEIGEYVRTNQGYIAKLLKFDSIIMYATFNKPIYKHNYTPCTMIYLPDLYNRKPIHSFNILDLLQEGDLITIELLYTPKEGTTKIKQIVIGEIMTLNVIKSCVEDKLFKIKNIVTKERIKATQIDLEE